MCRGAGLGPAYSEVWMQWKYREDRLRALQITPEPLVARSKLKSERSIQPTYNYSENKLRVEQDDSKVWGYFCNAVISFCIQKTLENVFQGFPQSKNIFLKKIQLTSEKDGMNFMWHFNSPGLSEDYRHHKICIPCNGQTTDSDNDSLHYPGLVIVRELCKQKKASPQRSFLTNFCLEKYERTLNP